MKHPKTLTENFFRNGIEWVHICFVYFGGKNQKWHRQVLAGNRQCSSGCQAVWCSMRYPNDKLCTVVYLSGQMSSAVFSQSTCRHNAVKANCVCACFLETAPQVIMLPPQSGDEVQRSSHLLLNKILLGRVVQVTRGTPAVTLPSTEEQTSGAVWVLDLSGPT